MGILSTVIDFIPGGAEGKLIAGLVGAAALVGAGIVIDRTAPIVGANAQIVKANAQLAPLNQAIGGYAVRMQADAARMQLDAQALKDRDKLISDLQGTDADEADQDAGRCAAQARTSYAAGLLYGRSHAGQPAAGSGGNAPGVGAGSVAGGVHDSSLTDLWNTGRFVPSTAPGGK